MPFIHEIAAGERERGNITKQLFSLLLPSASSNFTLGPQNRCNNETLADMELPTPFC